MTLDKVLTLIREDKIEEAFIVAEEIRKIGVPITTIRSEIYNPFQYYIITDRPKAERIVKIFGEVYKFRYWLK